MEGMLLQPKYIFLLACIFFSGVTASGQTSPDPAAPAHAARYTIGEIRITGNKKTKKEIIQRELPFASGDSLTPADLTAKMETARKQLMNTALFNHVVVAAGSFEEDKVNLVIEVKERWYLFPSPYFKPVDRNLNQWLVEQKGSLDRVNYGAKLTYNNVTGVNDKFRLWLITGYTRQFSFSYDRLYINRNLKWGTNTSFAAGKTRELNYTTENDKQLFLKDPGDYVRHFINAHIGFSYRPAIRTKHSFGIAFTSERITDTIVSLNPGYFKQGYKSAGYPSLFYNMTYFDLDYIPYPSKGYAANVSVSKSGLNHSINLWQLHIKGLGSWPLWKKTFFQLSGYAGIKLPFKQPYFNRRFLGYGDVYLQGYEYNVIDGVAGGYLRSGLYHELLNFRMRLAGGKGKVPVVIPFRVVGKIYGNTGYVYNPDEGNNRLSNKMLYTGGAGLDIVTAYDIVVRLEWSFNQLGQNDLFLHRKGVF